MATMTMTRAITEDEKASAQTLLTRARVAMAAIDGYDQATVDRLCRAIAWATANEQTFARLTRMSVDESGMGSAIAVLSAQVDDMTVALEKARGAANHSADSLEALTARGEAVAKRLELLVASLHDLPEPEPRKPAPVAEDSTELDRKLRFVRRRAPRETLEAAE